MVNTNVISNLEDLAGIIGTFRGVAKAADSDKFIQDLCMAANDRTLNKFNVMTGQKAQATPNGFINGLAHMYEYGVAGITQERGAVRIADPASDRARLWVFHSTPTAKGVETFVGFRPAKEHNLNPEERYDLKAVPADIKERMRDGKNYIFRNKAFLVEMGATVNIVPVEANALIYPSKENPEGYGFWSRNSGPMRVNLEGISGAKHKGAFTRHWTTWWKTIGEAMVRESAHNSFAARIAHARRTGKVNTRLKPVQATNVVSAAQKAAIEAEAKMMEAKYD